MKRLMISTLAIVAVLVAATTMLWSHTPSGRSVGPAAMASFEQRQGTVGVDKLPIEEFEDMSLVFSTATKR